MSMLKWDNDSGSQFYRAKSSSEPIWCYVITNSKKLKIWDAKKQKFVDAHVQGSVEELKAYCELHNKMGMTYE